MKRIIAILFTLGMLWQKDAGAQNDQAFALIRVIHGNIADFSVDNLGNIYTLNGDNRLKKFSPRGDSLATYNDVRQYGQVSSMDVTNPLKILLYYREFATVVMVDRFLSVINSIDLRKSNIFQARAVGLAYDNNIWVYDELEAKLKKIGDDGSVISTTTDIRQFVDVVPDPSKIIDQTGLVYLYDSTRGAYLFDYYGSLVKRVELPAGQDFSVIDKNLLVRDNQYFYRVTTAGVNERREAIPAAYLPAIKMVIMPSTVYVLKKTGLEVYAQK